MLGATAEHLTAGNPIVGAQAQEGSKVSLAGKAAHINPYLGDDGLGIHDIDAVDLGEVGPTDSVYLSPQIKTGWGIAASFLIGLGWRKLAPRLDPVFEALQMDAQRGVAFRKLLLIDVIKIQFLLQNEQQLLAPVAFQAAGDFLPRCLNPNIG